MELLSQKVSQLVTPLVQKVRILEQINFSLKHQLGTPNIPIIGQEALSYGTTKTNYITAAYSTYRSTIGQVLDQLIPLIRSLFQLLAHTFISSCISDMDSSDSPGTCVLSILLPALME